MLRNLVLPSWDPEIPYERWAPFADTIAALALLCVAAGTLARSGDQQGVVDALSRAWAMKPDGEVWKGCTEDAAADVSMLRMRACATGERRIAMCNMPGNVWSSR